MSKKALPSLVLILLIGSFVYFYRNLPGQLPPSTTKEEGRPPRPAGATPAGPAPTATPPTPTAAVPDAVGPAPAASAPAAPTRTFAQITSELMQTPEMQRSTQLLQRRVTEDAFGPFLRTLGITDEQHAEIIRLLTERRANQLSALVETSTGKLQGDELAATQARFLGTDERLSREVEGVLANPNLSQRVEEFAKTEPERGRVAQLGKSSAAAGEPLGEEQAAALTQALYQARRNAPFTHDFSDPLRSNPHLLIDEAVVDAYRREFQIQLNLERSAAAGLLTPAQLTLFDQVQQRQLTVFQNDLARQLRVMR
jgi:hypothetical protein